MDHWELLGLNKSGCTKDLVRAHYRSRAMKVHPDHGGDSADMAMLTAARDKCIEHLDKVVTCMTCQGTGAVGSQASRSFMVTKSMCTICEGGGKLTRDKLNGKI